MCKKAQDKKKEGEKHQGCKIRYLDINKQLPQVPGRHDNGGVELDDIALIQRNVVIGCEAL